MARSYAAQYSDYAVEGIKFFLLLQTYLADLREEYAFIPWLNLRLAVQTPREQTPIFSSNPNYQPKYLVPLGLISGDLLVEAVPLGMMNVERFKHEIAEEILHRIAEDVEAKCHVSIDLLGREENELNKRWFKREMEHMHINIVKAAQKGKGKPDVH